MGFGSHGHSHHHHCDGHSQNKKILCCQLSEKARLLLMLGMTFSFFLVELVIGQITKSVALTTDAVHMLSDTIALVIGLISIIVSGFVSLTNVK
jgi:cobalt-zinc-cadmium efflux system protein